MNYSVGTYGAVASSPLNDAVGIYSTGQRLKETNLILFIYLFIPRTIVPVCKSGFSGRQKKQVAMKRPLTLLAQQAWSSSQLKARDRWIGTDINPTR